MGQTAVPVPEATGTGSADTVTDPTAGAGPGTRFARRVRIAWWVIVLSLAWFTFTLPLMPLTELAMYGLPQEFGGSGRYPVWPSAAATALTLVCSLAAFWMAYSRVNGRRVAPWIFWGSLVLIVLACGLMRSSGYAFFLCGGWWAMVVLAAPRGRALHVTLALTALSPLHPFVSPGDPPLLWLVFAWLMAVLWSLTVSAGCLTMVRMWDVINDAREGHRARARLAVSQERLRFAHDMQGAIGEGLTTLAVRARRAELLVESDPARSTAEINEVHELARQVLQQVRSAVSGYRDIDLHEELASVSAVLRANGTATTVRGTEHLDRFADVAGTAAWVVREGTTNVLRHSDARRCRISFLEAVEAGRSALVVEVLNDRARGGTEGEGSSASGLGGLSERVSRGGGTLSGTRTADGGFLLRAVLPLPGGSRRPEEPR
ncbi:sensor histidine kinase [Nocardiopsis halotolerans]|uniref:sensor histidine kinase n=1 Tax=Nocardiopsis halotolerans TaxID=124252 RepID=UPI00034D0DFB|nr:histidine kinase [Nocardiopsis halotolerans]